MASNQCDRDLILSQDIQFNESQWNIFEETAKVKFHVDKKLAIQNVISVHKIIEHMTPKKNKHEIYKSSDHIILMKDIIKKSRDTFLMIKFLDMACGGSYPRSDGVESMGRFMDLALCDMHNYDENEIMEIRNYIEEKNDELFSYMKFIHKWSEHTLDLLEKKKDPIKNKNLIETIYTLYKIFHAAGGTGPTSTPFIEFLELIFREFNIRMYLGNSSLIKIMQKYRSAQQKT